MPNGRGVAVVVSGLLLASFAPAADSAESVAPPSSWTRKLWKSFADEARRYGEDTAALVLAPASWTNEDYQRAGAIALVLGGLMLADDDLDREAQRTRSAFTDDVSERTTRFGGRTSVYLATGLLLGGAALRKTEVRDMGRDALEASLLTHLLTKYVVKPAFGRERPEDSDGETVFQPFSHHSSFPSAHATQAFAFASVVAARSKGWVIPLAVYSAACLVAMDRVNDRAHFVSDVFAGAVLGTVTGRFLVQRHRTADGPHEAVSIEPILVTDGVGLRVRF